MFFIKFSLPVNVGDEIAIYMSVTWAEIDIDVFTLRNVQRLKLHTRSEIPNFEESGHSTINWSGAFNSFLKINFFQLTLNEVSYILWYQISKYVKKTPSRSLSSVTDNFEQCFSTCWHPQVIDNLYLIKKKLY